MGHQNDPTPVPIGASMTDDTDRVTTAWAEWFRKLSSVSDRTSNGGYVKLAGGIIIQWGVGEQNGAGSVPITFTKEFPNAVFAIIGNHIGTGCATVIVNALSRTAATLKIFNEAGGQSTGWTCYWIALGH